MPYLTGFLNALALLPCHSVQVKELSDPQAVFSTVIGLIVRLAEHGLIHCDFNEFNLMVGLHSLS